MSSYVAVILNEERVQVFFSFFSVSLFPWWCLSCLSFATFVFLFSLHISPFFFLQLGSDVTVLVAGADADSVVAEAGKTAGP